MTNFFSISRFFLLFVLSCTLNSQTEHDLEHNRSNPGLSQIKVGGIKKMEIEVLKNLLSASPERLKVMRRTIERVESMSAEEKQMMLKRLQRFKMKSAEEKKMIFSKLNQRRKILEEYLKDLDSVEKEKEMEIFLKLKEPERAEFIRKIRQKLNLRKN